MRLQVFALALVGLVLAPSAHAVLTASSISTTSVTLDWSGGTCSGPGWAVKRNGTTVASNIDCATRTETISTGQTAGSYYAFSIWTGGGGGTNTNQNLNLRMHLTPQLDSPAFIVSTLGATSFTLDWAGILLDTEPALHATPYKLQCRVGASGDFYDIASYGTATSLQVTVINSVNVVVDTLYNCKVWVRNSASLESESSILPITTIALPERTSTPASVFDQGVNTFKLDWAGTFTNAATYTLTANPTLGSQLDAFVDTTATETSALTVTVFTTFTLVAKSATEIESSPYQFSFGPPTRTATNAALTVPGLRSFTLGWADTFNLNSASGSLQYRVVASPSESVTGLSGFSDFASGLSAALTNVVGAVEFTITARNPDGIVSAGYVVTFGAPTISGSTTIQSPGVQAFTLNWSTLCTSHSVPDTMTYSVTASPAISGFSGLTGVSDTSRAFTGVTGATTFTITCINSYGVSRQTTTSRGPPTLSGSDPYFSNIGVGGFRLNWPSSFIANSDPATVTYTVTSTPAGYSITDSSDTFNVFSSMAKDVVHSYSIVAKNSDGISSAPFVRAIGPCVAAAGAVTFNSVSQTGFTALWGSSFTFNGLAGIFSISVSPGTFSATGLAGSSQAVTGLVNNTNYAVTVGCQNIFSDIEATKVGNQLTLPAPPSEKAFPIVSAVTSSGFTVNWANTFQANGPYTMQYQSTTAITAPFSAWTYNTPSTDTSRIYSSLTPNTLYSVRVQAREGTTGDWSSHAQVHVMTAEAIPLINANNIAFSSVSAYGMTVNWGSVCTNRANVSLEYSVSMSPSCDCFTPLTNSPNIEASISGLTAYTQYTFTVECRNNIGSATGNKQGQQQTSQGTPKRTAVAGSILPTDYNRLELDLTGTFDPEGVFKDYTFVVSPNHGTFTTAASANIQIRTGLNDYTEYTFTVKARNTLDAESTETLVLSARTLANNPTVNMARFRTSSITANQINLLWSDDGTPLVTNTNPLPITFGLRYSLVSPISYTTITLDPNTVTSASTPASLAPFQDYRFEFTVWNAAENVTVQTKDFKTLSLTPTITSTDGKISSTQQSNSDDDTKMDVTINWTNDAFTFGAPTGTFSISYRIGAGSETSFLTNGGPALRTATATALDANTEYIFTFRVDNSDSKFDFIEIPIKTEATPSQYDLGTQSFTQGTITSTSIHVSWPVAATPNGPQPYTYRLTYVAQQPNPDGTSEVQVLENSDLTEHTITGLQPGVLYTISVQMRNDDSEAYGNKLSVSIRTLAGSPVWPGVFDFNAPTAITTTGFTISWPPVFAQDDPSNIRYRLTYEALQPNKVGQTVTEFNNALTTPSATLTGLQSGIQYRIRVSAWNSFEESPGINAPSFSSAVQTTEVIPEWNTITETLVVRNSTSSADADGGSSTMLVSWPVIYWPNSLLAAIQYRVVNTAGSVTVCANSAARTCSVSSLQPYTLYNFVIHAQNNAGSTNPGLSFQHTTAAAPPQFAISDVITFSNVASNGFTLNLRRPSNLFGPPLENVDGTFLISAIDDSFGDTPAVGDTLTIEISGSNPQVVNVYPSVVALLPYRLYTVRVYASTTDGISETFMQNQQRTSAAQPFFAASHALTLIRQEPFELEISWPDLSNTRTANGLISQYVLNIYFNVNNSLVHNQIISHPVTSYTFEELSPFTEYRITVSAQNNAPTNNVSPPIEMVQRTFSYYPASIPIPVIKSTSDSSVVLSWDAFDTSNGPIIWASLERQRLISANPETFSDWEIVANRTSNLEDFVGFNVPSAPSSVYRYRLTLATAFASQSGFLTVNAATQAEAASTAWVGGVVVLLLLLILVIFLVYRKKVQKKSIWIDKKFAQLRSKKNKDEDIALNNVSTGHGRDTLSAVPSRVILAEELADRVAQLHANSDLGFAEEYESLTVNEDYASTAALLPVNKSKNRYANILPYDHSRVRLSPLPGIEGSDYTNANYIDGYRKPHAYIACQGPLPDTFDDFWRMVWEQRSAVIVMVTNEEEKGRVKCHRYWPDETEVSFGDVDVRMTSQQDLPEYIVRIFSLKNSRTNESRVCTHIQFTGWPDHGVPQSTTSLIKFVKTSRSLQPKDAGPMIVHCSAGVGRTGTFIVTDISIERVKTEGNVDIFGAVSALRRNRMYMVQTEDQYIFIYSALVDAIANGDSEVSAREFPDHVAKLSKFAGSSDTTGFEEEYLALQQADKKNHSFEGAQLSANKSKNRYANILPFEHTRVKLLAVPGTAGSDYINASYIDGFRKRRAYVATQGPLPGTVNDFWRMIWEQKVEGVVMISCEEENGRVKCHKYWPEKDSLNAGAVRVTLLSNVDRQHYVLRRFEITHNDAKETRQIDHFQFLAWPDTGVPSNTSKFIEFVYQVKAWQSSVDQGNPVVVHCSAGVGRTGAYIAIDMALDRLVAEGVVDVFHTVKMLRSQRPNMVQTQEQYEFVYTAVLEYIRSNS